MTDEHEHSDSARIETDGGVPDQREQVDYLDAEINILKPATPFMRDHLKLIWALFAAWALAVFGPVTATALAPDLMTNTVVFGFQLHFLLTSIGATASALALSAVYAWRRDRLDAQYGIGHTEKETDAEPAAETAVAQGERDD